MAGNLVNANPNRNQVYTVRDGMVLCGIDDESLFQDQTPAERFASDIFSNSFSMCLDKTMEEVNNDIKQYSSLTQAQGQIRITPGNRQNIQAFIQWVRDMLRTGREPSLEPFPLQDVANLIRNYKSHKAYMDKSKTVSEAARPIRFKENMHWEDWAPTFLNFLRAIPGRNGVPLSYICREYDEAAQHNPNIDFMENYIEQAPLYGDAFNIDAAEVHTYLINFTSGNDTAEIKMLPNAACKNGRLDYRALQEHYEGTGVNAINIIKAEDVLKNLFYAGEKKPAMWWDEFEKRLTHAFTIIHKKEKRSVYSNEMKLRVLITKINADFLQNVKAAMSIELTRTPLMMTYEQALMTFRNEVNRKHPPEISNSRSRRINEVSSRGPRGMGRGRGRGNPRNGGRGGRGPSGRGRGRGTSRGHPNARIVTGTNGRPIEIHPSYNFPPGVWEVIPPAEKRRINEERAQYRASKRQKISSVAYVPPAINVQSDESNSLARTSITGAMSVGRVNAQINSNNGYGGTMMGGRNEQESVRSRNTNNIN